MPRLLALAVSFATLAGCAGARLVRVQAPEPSAGPPAIDRLVDLGGLAPAASGELSAEEGDGRFTPGEWVAVLGSNLGGDAVVAVDGRPLEKTGYLQGGSLLVRVPRGLSALEEHTLTVTTPRGEASTPLPVHSYVVAADTDGDAVRFLRASRDAEELFEEEPTVIDMRRAKYHAMSPDGALLFVVQTPKKEERDRGTICRSQLAVIHLGAKDRPRRIASLELELPSPPSGLAARSDGVVVVLAEHDLLVVDASRPATPEVVGRLALVPETETATRAFVDVEIVAGGDAAALETYGNTLQLVDLHDPTAPRAGAKLALAGDVPLPLSIDLAPDAEQPDALWVLQGPNFRVAGKEMKGAFAGLKRGAVALYGAAVGDETEAEAAREEAPAAQSVCRLLRVRVDGGRLEAGRALPLPADFFPLFVLPRADGGLYVSGVNGDVFDFTGVELSLDGMKRVLAVLKDTAQLGRILRVDASGEQPARTVLQGMAVYFNLDAFPDGPLVYSTLRIGPKVFPPSIGIDWGAEVQERAFVPLRRLGWEYLLPPYSYSLLGMQ